jgi:hypothetical protein
MTYLQAGQHITSYNAYASGKSHFGSQETPEEILHGTSQNQDE